MVGPYIAVSLRLVNFLCLGYRYWTFINNHDAALNNEDSIHIYENDFFFTRQTFSNNGLWKRNDNVKQFENLCCLSLIRIKLEKR